MNKLSEILSRQIDFIQLIRTILTIKRHPFASRKEDASYTIEASIVLPIFVSLMAGIMTFFWIILIQYGIGMSLNATARELAVWGNDPSLALAVTRCNVKIKSNEVPTDYIKNGYLGLDYSDSSCSDEIISLVVKYRINIPILILGTQEIRIEQRAAARVWCGYDPEADEDTGYVYVTKRGVAYHESLSCPYLKLSIQTVPLESVSELRNKSAGRYHKCSSCTFGSADTYVYITDYGDEYHSSLSCNSLKRTISRISRESALASGYHACDKCAG